MCAIAHITSQVDFLIFSLGNEVRGVVVRRSVCCGANDLIGSGGRDRTADLGVMNHKSSIVLQEKRNRQGFR